jgi:hypothetical protein
MLTMQPRAQHFRLKPLHNHYNQNSHPNTAAQTCQQKVKNTGFDDYVACESRRAAPTLASSPGIL